MALETASFINQLDAANPAGPDRLANGDDHIRMIKAVLKATFPALNGPVTVTKEQLNALSGSAVPFGLISLWYGSAAQIPAGYWLCDGSTATKTGGGTVVTPDLRGKVPMGASGTTYLPGTTYGQNSKTITTAVAGAHGHTASLAAGGSHNHTVSVAGTSLSIAQMPAHTHTVPTSNGNASPGGGMIESSTGPGGFTSTTSSVGGGASHTHTATTAVGEGTHSHEAAITAAVGHSHAATVDVLQASYALHFIMKV